MKRYLINHNCIYNEARNEIKNTDSALIIKMTAMRARCLSFIIENAAEGIIDKQKMTSALWGERGQFRQRREPDAAALPYPQRLTHPRDQ